MAQQSPHKPPSPSLAHLALREHRPLHFPTQRPGEHIILLLRRHWSIIAVAVMRLVALLLLPPLIITFLLLYTTFTFEPGTAFFIIVVETLSLYYLFAFMAYFHNFVDYHLDIWVVTDQRIVSIEQEALFRRTISELNILRVQDVTSEVHGKVQTFLNFGQVHIQTAGERERFVFEQIPNPSAVAKLILQIHDRAIQLYELERMREREAFAEEYKASSSAVQGQHPSPPPRISHDGRPPSP